MGISRKRARYTLHFDDEDGGGGGEVGQQGVSQQAGGGGHGAGVLAGKESIEPEKKLHLANATNTLRFVHTYRNWYEIDTGLFCVPSQHSIHSMFTKEVKTLAGKFINNGTYVYAHFNISPIRLSNFIVLSDNIQTTGGVNEVSSFVQNSKILHIKVSEPDIGSAYAMYVKNVDDTTGRLALPYSNCNSGTSYNDPGMLAKLKFGSMKNDDYDIEDIGIFTFKEQAITGMKKVRPTVNSFGIFDYTEARSGGITSSELDVYPSTRLNTWNVQNQLKDYKMSIIDATQLIHCCAPKYAPLVWSSNSPYSADKIIMPDKLPEYQTAISASGQAVKNSLVWQPQTKNYGAFIKEDVGSEIHATKRLAGRIDNSKCHDYITLIPIRKSDGTRMKLRASVLAEATITIHFMFRERALEEASLNIDEMQDWMEIVGGGHHEAHPNLKGIMTDAGMTHFTF